MDAQKAGGDTVVMQIVNGIDKLGCILFDDLFKRMFGCI